MMDATDFLHSDLEAWREVPHTALEVSSYGRIRTIDNMSLWGFVKYQEDLGGVLDGSIPAWNPDSVVMQETPPNYFKYRGRNDKEQEAARVAEYNLLH